MNLLADIRNFFARERLWGGLLVLALGIYAVILWWPGRTVEEPRSEALEALRLAELRFRDQIHSTGGVKEFLAQKPELALVFNLFSVLLLATVLLGLLLDFFWFTRRDWRERLRAGEGPPEARSWNVSTIFKIVVLFFLASLGLSLFLAFVRAVLFPQTTPNLFILLHTTLSDLFCMGLVIYFIRRMGGRWQDLGFRRSSFWKDLGLGLAGYVAILPVFIIVLVVLAVLAYLFTYEPPPHPLVEVFLEEEKRAPFLVAYSVFLACVAGPIFEEIFFRGFCYPAFKKKWGIGWALVLSAAFFGLIHQNLFAFWPIFVLGLGLAYLYEKRGTLIPSIALHIFHNSIFIAYFFLAKEVLAGG